VPTHRSLDVSSSALRIHGSVQHATSRASITRLVVSFVVVLGAIAALAPISSSAAATLSGTVSGQLPGKEAEALPGATVTVSDSATGESIGSTVTDEGGKYSIEVPSGVFDVRVDPAPGPFELTTVHKVEVTGSRILNVVLTPSEAVHLTGTMRDASGNPVSNVTLITQGGPASGLVTRTAADGSYSFALVPGTYALAISPNESIPSLPTYWSLSTAKFSIESDQHRDITLPPTATLTVEALGKEDTPIAEANVEMHDLHSSVDLGGFTALDLQSRELRGLTGKDGRVSFLVFGGGGTFNQEPSITPPPESGYGFTSFKVPPVEGDTTVVVHPVPAVHLTGTMRDASGNPVSNVTLITQGGPASGLVTRTAADGSYSFALVPGTYALAISPNESIPSLPTYWSLSTAKFSIESDQHRDITLPPTATLTVEALGKEDTPIAEANVEMHDLHSSVDLGGFTALDLQSRELRGLTGKDGRVSFLVFGGGGTFNQEPSITPPPESGYGFTSFKVPPVEGDTTVVVHFQGGSQEDHTAPQVDELGFEPPAIDTSASAQTLFVAAHITDDLSGFSKGSIAFHSPSGEQQASGAFELTSGSPTNGDYRTKVPFERFSESGLWTATVILTDAAGNSRELSSTDLKEAGLPSFIQVNSEEDGEAPRIDELSFEPSNLDTTSSAQTVFVTAHITDDVSGLFNGNITFHSPAGAQQVSGTFELIAGSPTNGAYRTKVPFAYLSESGSWTATVTLTDVAGNRRELSPADLQEAGLPFSVQVTGKEDHTAPQVDELGFEPPAIDTSASAQTLFVAAHITDDLSGFSKGSIAFHSPSGEQQASGAFELTSGSPTNGDYRTKVPFERFSESGLWTATVILTDAAGNSRELSSTDLKEAGLPSFIQVNSEEDGEAPRIDELSINPSEIDTSETKQPVTLTAHITDDLSGFKDGTVRFVSPSGSESTSGGEFKRVSGTETNGAYKILVTFERFSEVGVWQIESIRLSDHAGNEAVLGAGQIEELGLAHTVVVSSQPPVVTEISPSFGSESGGTAVQISGAGFSSGSTVHFGKTSATKVSVNSPTSITAVAPAGTGTVDVTVTTPAGTSATGTADRFSYSPPVSLTSSPNPSVHGQKVTFTAKVTPITAGAPAPLGTVALLEGAAILGAANLNKGTATFNTTTLGAGEHTITAVYSGDSYFGPGISEPLMQTVSKASTQLTLVSSLNPAPYGSAATLKATVKAVAPGAGTPAGTITFSDGPTVLTTVQLSGASVSYPLKSLSPGTHEITATYSGDPNNEPSKSPTVTQTIVTASTETALTSSLNPAPYGSSATLKAKVEPVAPAGGTPSGTVVFREGPTELATVPLSSGGVAKYALKTTPPGSYEITATYSGDANYEASESSISQQITKAETELSLTSTLNPAPYGSSGTLKATIKAVPPGGGSPTGTVTFSEGSTVLATVSVSSGTAKYALKSMDPGTHEITAIYNGDANYEASEAGIAQTITKASTTLTLTSSKNPAPAGSSGSLKATVKAVAPGGGMPTGTVTFSEGATVLASVPLSGNAASYPLKSLSVGTHEITATYGGSANYEASEGAISQAITP
jgi:Big-like domain-containing protein/IPT/TIG domain-containing protein